MISRKGSTVLVKNLLATANSLVALYRAALHNLSTLLLRMFSSNLSERQFVILIFPPRVQVGPLWWGDRPVRIT